MIEQPFGIVIGVGNQKGGVGKSTNTVHLAAALGEKGIRVTDVQEARWGSIAKIRLPGGSEVGLYQPKHPTALALTSH